MSRLLAERPAAWLESVIGDFIDHSKENTLQNQRNDPAFEPPLVGFASGADPLWESYKEHVGPFHWTPLEIFDRTFPGSGVRVQNLTVISWVLPQTAATKADNRKETFYPAERWARARIFGEEVNVKLRKHVTEVLQQKGYAALAPQLSSEWSRKDSPRYVYASTWSERHAAYAAGLGTFGLCDGLITPVGKAVRVGSVIANIQIRPTPRPYTDHHAYCLFYTQGLCGKCIPRCPVGALSENGHDKRTCRNHIRPVTEDYVKANFGFEGYGCGLCQTGVPCESKIPTKMDVS
jgi:epoxyqueuosine reductase